MIIKSITLNNYRLYKGKNTIFFSSKDEKNIYIVSGENGFGKTTFLHSLMWCLYGKMITEVETEVRRDITSNGYNAFLRSNLNNQVRTEVDELSQEEKKRIKRKGYSPDNLRLKDITQYSVAIDFGEVIIPSLPCTSLKVIRSYDILQEKEQVEIFIDGTKNELANEIGPEVFINDFILNKDIARLFFFDSEQIVALAETNTASKRRRLCSAYNEVLGVRKYEDLKKNIDNARLRFRRKSSDTKSRELLLSLIDKKDAIEHQIENNNLFLLKMNDELKGLKAKDEALQLQLIREGNNSTTKDIKRIEELIIATKKKDEEYKKQLKVFLEYAPIAMVGKLFSETKQQLDSDFKRREARSLQLSSNIVVSDITEELLLMIRNINISQDTSLKLQKRIQTILSKYKKEVQDDETLLVMPENDYEEFLAIYSHISTTYRSEFEHMTEDYKKNKQVLERNSRRLSNIKSKEKDELIKKIRAEKNALESDIDKKELEIRKTHEVSGTLNQELSNLSKQISELGKKVRLDDSDEKKDLLAEQLSTELSLFLISLKEEKKFSLERRIKLILNALMHKEDFIGKVEVVISGEDMDINLYTADNLLINKDSLSKGEQQLYATSILKALVDESGIQFPVFIDSPLQKFDKSHATKIITEFYPKISKQVVLFPLLYKEMSYEEYEVMKPLVNATYMIKNDTTHSYFEQVEIDNFITSQQ